MSDKRVEGFSLAVGKIAGVHNFRIIHVSQADFDHDLPGFDHIILSGSPDNLAKDDDSPDLAIITKYEKEIQFLQNTKKPVLGICFGHELLAVAFGFKCKNMVNRNSEVNILGQNVYLPLQKSFPLFPHASICVDFSHTQEIQYSDPSYKKNFEDVFELYSSSPNCIVQMIHLKSSSQKLFGVQFHPETLVTPQAQLDGQELIMNFLKMN